MALAFEQEIAAEGLQPLPIGIAHAATAGALRVEHADPFDRLLVAQSQMEAIPLVSNEALFDGFGVTRLW